MKARTTTRNAATGPAVSDRDIHPFRSAGIAGLLVSACVWCLFPASLRAGGPAWNATHLGTFFATDVNEKGQIAGYILKSGGYTRAALHSNGKVTDLGTLPGGASSMAFAINDRGVVVGDSLNADGLNRAFRYEGGKMIDLGTLHGGVESSARDINNAGQIVGWSVTTQPGISYPSPDHAFLYANGRMSDLGNISSLFGNFSHAVAINNSGEVVGWSINDSFETHAFVCRGGIMTDLGTLGGSESRANDINDDGTIVGWSYLAGDTEARAFVAARGTAMKNLGKLAGEIGSSAKSINRKGEIVGGSIQNGRPSFYYSPGLGLLPINPRVRGDDWELDDAFVINDAGQILANGGQVWTSSGYYLLQPSPKGPDIDVMRPAGNSLVDGKSKIDFGSVGANKSRTLKFTIRNNGRSKLAKLRISLTGKQKRSFLIAGPSKTSLAPGSSTTFKVKFRPRAGEIHKSEIHIRSNDPNENPFDIRLKGRRKS